MSQQENIDSLLAQSLQQQNNYYITNVFENRYIVLPTAQWKVSDDKKLALEQTNNILLPESALNALMANNCSFPIILQITNPHSSQIITQCVGVQEFSSIDGMAVIPNHIMHRLQYPSVIDVKYINLPKATSITLQPQHQTDKISLKYIRQTLCKLTCLSLVDTIQVVIDDKSFNLDVKKVEPSMDDAVSLQDVVYSVDINILQPIEADNDENDDIDDNDECPIVSSISNTKGSDSNDNDDCITKGASVENANNDNNDNNDTMGGPDDCDDTDNNNNNDDNTGWDDDDSDDNVGWGDNVDDEFSDFSYDGQDYLPIKGKEFTPPPKRYAIDDELIPDPNSTDDGNNRKLRPVTGNCNHRAWICEFCHAINNLLDSMNRNYKCNCCSGKYRPGQTLIESKKQDEPLPQCQTYTVWVCPCSRMNMIDWTQCAMCSTKKPDEGLVTFISPEQPNPAPMEQRVAVPEPAEPASPRSDSDAVDNNNQNKLAKWLCTKCLVYNAEWSTVCCGCFKHRYIRDNDGNDGDNKMEKEVKVFRRNYSGHVGLMGNQQNKRNYPVLNGDIKCNMRLIEIFGTSYRNSMIVNDMKRLNIWRRDDHQIGNGMISVDDGNFELKPLNARCIAINERNGYIVQISLDWMVILEPKGANEFAIKAALKLELEATVKKLTLARVRFVGDNIYVFHYDTSKIYHYWFDEEHLEISFVSILYDKYFSESMITDILVTDELLIILFDRWLGVYRLYPALEWYHAVAYSKTDNVSVSSLEMSCYDDWEDRVSIEEENYFKAIIDNKQYDDDDMKREDEEKQCVEDGVFMNKIEYKQCIKNYIFINCENSIIAIHPTNPTFDFLHIADNVKQGSSFCNSKKYGIFYINNEYDRIMQSGGYDEKSVDIVCEIGSDDFEWKDFKMIPYIDGDKNITNKDIVHFNGVLYDEGYGISGRLLVNCMVQYDDTKKIAMYYELFNWNELIELKRELSRNDYFWMPGTKTFNLIVFVFEMLYGTDLIDLLLQSADFNSVYALPGMEEKDENEEEEEEEEEKEENKNDGINEENKNKLIKVGSNVLIYVNKRWCDGIVLRMVDDKNDSLEIGYSSLANGGDADRALILNRYDKCLKYNEQIPLTETKYVWQIGDKCLYNSDGLNCWNPGEIINIFTSDDGTWLAIRYNLENNQSKMGIIEYDDKILQNKLIKVHDVIIPKEDVKINENHDGDGDGDDDDDNMDLEKEAMAEGILGESYVAVNDEDLIEMEQHDGIFVVDEDDNNMEIEQEGVNEVENN